MKSNKPLRTLFEAMYREKYDFQDFLSGETSAWYETHRVDNRLIRSPNKKLKTYQTFLNLFIFEYLPIAEGAVFSYRKGFNVYDAVEKHASRRHFFQTDIDNFFGSIDRELVTSMTLVGCTSSPVGDLDVHWPRIFDLVLVDGVLPVGFVTSPTISNACLYHFDQSILEHTAPRDLTYTRYADDIIISGDDRDAVREMNAVVRDRLAQTLGGKLKLNPAKSKFTSIGRKVRLLGLVVLPNGRVTIDMKVKREVETLIYLYLNDRTKFLDYAASELGPGIARMSGLLSYINTIDKPYLERLRRKYGATTVDMFLHRSST